MNYKDSHRPRGMAGRSIFNANRRVLYKGRIQGTMERWLDCKICGGRIVFVLFTVSIPGLANKGSVIFFL